MSSQYLGLQGPNLRSHHSNRSSHSAEKQSTTAKKAECAAQLAAKKAEMNMEEAIAAQKQELKKPENQRDLDVITAKLKTYSEADSNENCSENQAACKFLEWRKSFKARIERRCIDPADRLFYLQKYINGEARSVVEGSFYRKDDEAYNQAWEALNAGTASPL